MKHRIDRRAVLVGAAAAAVAAVAGPLVAQAANIRGEVTFEGGAAVPKGRLEIALEDPAAQDGAQRRAAETRIDSDGGSKAIAFDLSPPAGPTASQRIVARLERADGWLVARGSAEVEAGAPVRVELSTVMYE